MSFSLYRVVTMKLEVNTREAEFKKVMV